MIYVKFDNMMRKMKKNKLLIILICLFFIAVNSYGSEIDAKARLDTNEILIGDQTALTLEFHSDTGQKVVWPQIPDTIGAIEVIRKSKIDSLIKNGILIRSQNITLTCFDSGSHSIAPFTFMYERKGHTTLYPEESEPLTLYVNTVPVDTSDAIKDIKPPLEEPVSWTEYLIYFLIALLAIAIIIAIIYFIRKRKPKEKEEDLGYDPSIPPHILALQSLKSLDKEKLWQKGRIKLYYIKITEIIRLYIKRQFHINAPEMITPEIIDELEKNRFDEELISDMKALFELADLVKFAKYQPIPDENSKMMSLSVNFVEKTKPEETIDQEKNKEDVKV